MIADRDLVMRTMPRATGRRRYHFHAPGLIYIAVTLFLAIGAINSQNNLLFAALGLAIGGLLVSGVLSGSSLLGVRVQRLPIGRATAGKPLTIVYFISNENRFAPAFGLNIIEHSAPKGAGPSAWAGRVVPPRAFVAHVTAKSNVIAESIMLPRRRGACELRSIRVWSTFPFGLVQSVTFELPQPFVVQPVGLTLQSELIERITARSSVGMNSERSPGMGDEFFGLREYVPGDTPRRIAWRRTARTGDVVVRQNSSPSPARLWVVLRLDGTGEEPVRLGERAIALAAAVLRHAAADGVAIGLAVTSPRIVVPPASGPRHLDRLLNELGLIDLSAVPRGVAEAPLPAPIARGSAIVVVHAGRLARSGTPPSAAHLVASELESYIADNRQTPADLLALDHDSATAPRIRFARRVLGGAAALVSSFAGGQE